MVAVAGRLPGRRAPGGGAARAPTGVLGRLAAVDGAVALFAHGHILRVLTARWLELPVSAARGFGSTPGPVSILGFERETQVILQLEPPRPDS